MIKALIVLLNILAVISVLCGIGYFISARDLHYWHPQGIGYSDAEINSKVAMGAWLVSSSIATFISAAVLHLLVQIKDRLPIQSKAVSASQLNAYE